MKTLLRSKSFEVHLKRKQISYTYSSRENTKSVLMTVKKYAKEEYK